MSALIQGTEEWLEFRKSMIGASDAPVIMGVSPWKTPNQLWEEKLGLREPCINAAMRRGTEMEEEARKAFEEKTGHTVFPSVLLHSEKSWMMASVDGIDMEGKIIVEIKCPGKVDHEIALSGEVPEKYYPQLQHIMYVASVDKIYYFSYSMNSSIVLEVRKNEKYIREMLDREEEFYRCLQHLEAPKLQERDFVQKNDDLWMQASQRYKEVQKLLLSLKEEEDFLRQTLVCMSGKCNVMGNGIKLTKVLRKGSVDYSKIPELEGVDLEKYRKEKVESWRIQVLPGS